MPNAAIGLTAEDVCRRSLRERLHAFVAGVLATADPTPEPFLRRDDPFLRAVERDFAAIDHLANG